MTKMQFTTVPVESVEVKREKAALLVVDGEEAWVPLSNMSDNDANRIEEGDQDIEIKVAKWFADQKGW